MYHPEQDSAAVLSRLTANTIPLINIIKEQRRGEFKYCREKDKLSTVQTDVRLLRDVCVHDYYVDYAVNEFVQDGYKEDFVIKNTKNRYLVYKQKTLWLHNHKLYFALTDPDKPFLCDNTVGKILVPNEVQHSFLGILNSKLIRWYFHKTAINNKTTHRRVTNRDIKYLPIPKNVMQPTVSKLVEYMLFLRNKNSFVGSCLENEFRYCHTLDDLMASLIEHLIDACVYEIYFEEEIKSTETKKTDVLVLTKEFLAKIETLPTEQQINALFTELNEYKGEIRNRIILQTTRSPSVEHIKRSLAFIDD
jgi:hypothetical protein